MILAHERLRIVHVGVTEILPRHGLFNRCAKHFPGTERLDT